MESELHAWIDPRHLTDAAVAAAAARYASDPFQSIHFDDFLVQPRLERLRSLFEGDGLFRPNFGIYDSDGHVQNASREEYLLASEETRFEMETVLAGPPPERPMAPGFLAHLTYLRFVASEGFRAFLSRIVQEELGAAAECQVRIMQPNNFVRPHTDSSGGRRHMCLVLYPGRKWHPEEGGLLRQFRPDGKSRVVEPLPNRLILFRVSRDSLHEVQPLASEANPRWAYTVWLGGADSV